MEMMTVRKKNRPLRFINKKKKERNNKLSIEIFNYIRSVFESLDELKNLQIKKKFRRKQLIHYN